ncbi:hypothetical protein COW36_14475 [bacterium (Candidatus Blackallbacteria) CG17_big_fil_post_rev_8_21_14_2_50_48_46]|uniref:Uncharacterized protein n=1 Tax=bacterium (Candidatus Blackallbacteria) CG17_big_fil_post_rev_8_21_14_2_50_48_46 TaxID=2014261 RepID=A0A2M7G296_9BACT|nr:MAG: hypothetical protein COW64_12075 [bacterium (Candidatus Blackallbacteria) CG18_big_fil_WC_8_21_14_2_50_49_26]PIW15921.1 MAG: hypothetical protein COW36_14475 [bacterium (Candidatus Blackallbacteria) CG17_big_fil_post_rev_8_21_14_2_50_48_46]PIW50333.1 MAG: hypothetical protein COW20_02190 [bacterium (Candidatus Blackallbacteria) CG13_big_fil_rev_8_21_14_2_50_49_14]
MFTYQKKSFSGQFLNHSSPAAGGREIQLSGSTPSALKCRRMGLLGLSPLGSVRREKFVIKPAQQCQHKECV